MEPTKVTGNRRIAKPLGVTLLTAFDGLFIGLVPLAALLFIDNNPALEISRLDYYLTAFLRIIVVAAALGAFIGENLGRIVLMWAVTAVSVLMILGSIGFLSEDKVEGSEGIRLIGNITRALFWIGLNWWYLNRKGVADYYKQDHRLGDKAGRTTP